MNHQSLVLATWMAGLLFLPIPSFSFIASISPVTAQPVASELSSEQLKKLAQSITVKILSGDTSGSGILIKKDGQVYTVLTNQHVLTPGETVRIQTPDGSFHQATLVKGVNFQGKDLALLQFRASANYAVASLTNLATVAVNEPIFAAGFPFEADQGSGFTLTTGQVLYVPERAFKEGYQIGYSNDIEKGMSGGPILNRRGQVIGINGIHAEPLWGDPYVYEDGSRPTEAEQDLMSRYSWGIPIQTFAQSAPQYASQDALTAGTPTATEENLPPIANDVNNIAQQITVLIRWEKGNGSGVIVGKKGNTYTVLTAEHVIRNKSSVEVVTPDGKQYSIAVDDSTVKEIPGADLAIFQFTSNQNYRVATLANYVLQYGSETGSEAGGFIFVSGWAGTGKETGEPKRSFSAGVVFSNIFLGSLLAKNSLSLNYGYKLLYTNLTEGGMSGGPVLDIRGRVIGIHGRADDEEIIDKAGRTRHVPLGFSLGVPISAFVNQLKEMGLERELRVETFPPPPLTQEEQQAIIKALFNPKEPNANADAIDWLNYGWQVARSGEESENVDKKAIAAFDRAIQLEPDLYPAWYLRGFILSIKNPDREKYQESLESLNRAIKIKSNFYQAWRWRGVILSGLERYQEALESIDRASQIDDPKEVFVKSFKIILLVNLERYSEALEAANQFVKSHSDSWSYAVRGAVRAKMNDYQEALADWNEAVRLDPKDATNYNNRGYFYYTQEKYPEAIADYTEAIRLNPQNSLFYRNRSDAYYAQKNYQEVIADLNEAVRLDPKDATNYKYRGDFYYVQEKYSEAIADYTEAIRLNPQNSLFYRNRSNAYYAQKNYQEALANLNEAVRLEPKDATNYKYRGDFYYTQEKYPEAIADYTEAIRLNPQAPIFYKNRGNAYSNQKNYQEAIADYTEVIRLQPDNTEAYAERAVARFRSEDGKGAIEDLNEILRLKPGDVQAYYARGLIRAGQNDYSGAIEDYNQVLRTQEIGRIGLQPEINAQTKVVTIVAVTENSPADKGGIKTGDQILQIDNQPTANLSIEEVLNLLRGQKGTQVTLRISRPDKRESKVTLIREQMIEPQFAEAYYNRGLARLELRDKQGAQEDLKTAADLYEQQNNTEMYQTTLKKLQEL